MNNAEKLDAAIQKFKAYCQGNGDFDELDLKKVIFDVVEDYEQTAYKNGYVDSSVWYEQGKQQTRKLTGVDSHLSEKGNR